MYNLSFLILCENFILFVTTSEHDSIRIINMIYWVQIFTSSLRHFPADEDEEENEEVVPKAETQTQLERWEMSLMACTSFSQLFLHFSTLG